jgi:cytidylate kinase
MAVLTISASYAAGGSELGPRIATRLGVPFIDRAIPVEVARKLGIPVEEAEAVAQKAPGRLWGLVASMAAMPGYLDLANVNDHVANERQLIESTEEQINKAAAAGSCVILGRAAALVLKDRPDALHIRLDGSVPGRVKAAMHQHGISEASAKAALKENDQLREGYVEHFYGRDPRSPHLYHLVVDTVRVGWDCAEEIIVTAARRYELAPPSGSA